ncbi:MAG: hypothetical protein F6K56_01745 [Moorea sp. SIO3G5]|nr:hypothetical protein [Moorena sp. SIO3G5]
MKTPNSQSIHDRPRGQFSLGVSALAQRGLRPQPTLRERVLVGSALKVRLPSFSSSSGVPHRTLFYLKGYSSRFTRQLLIDDWVFKEDFPYPNGITSLWAINCGSLFRLSQRFLSLYLSRLYTKQTWIFRKPSAEGRGFKPNIFDKFVDSTMIGTNRRFPLRG